ncbi:MFS transporter [Micromonospora sp. NPDC049175]|uniref:MFS transporter n=1 Tax=unclassified Micromonospora TaxID=2617518 RepID=UPI003717C050
MRELLRDKVYLRYWLAVVVSYLGDGIVKVTVVYVAATLTDAPALFIAAVVIAQLVPSGILGTFIGPLVDRMSPRSLLVGADLARVAIVLAMIPASHHAALLLVLIFLEGLGKAVFETARMAAIPKVVGNHSLPAAIGLFQSTVQTLNLVGPLVGGVLIATTGVRWSFIIDAATFVVSALLLGNLAVLRNASVVATPAGQYWQSLRDGIRRALGIPTLRIVAWMMVPAMIAFGVFTTNVNTQLLVAFGLGAFDFGLATAMLGAGAILGAFFGPVLVKRVPLADLLAAAVALFAVSLVLLWPIDHFRFGGLAVICAWCALAGMGMSLVQVPVANILLRDLPDDLRGRGIALLNALMVNFTIIGVLLGGAAANFLGIAASIIVTGVILIVPAIALTRTTRRIDRQPARAAS